MRCNMCKWEYCTTNLAGDRKHFLTYCKAFFCNDYAKEISRFKTATLSLSECTIEIFSHLGSLGLNTPPPHPTLLSHLLSWKPQLWKDRTEAADWDWPVSLWLKTAMVCPPTPCMVNGWSFGTSGDPSFSPVAPRAVSSSLRLNRTWGTQMTVKNRQRKWRHHIRLGYILLSNLPLFRRMLELVISDWKHPGTKAACPTLCARPTSQVLGQCPIFFPILPQQNRFRLGSFYACF